LRAIGVLEPWLKVFYEAYELNQYWRGEYIGRPEMAL
jgi:hypothetical protein